MTPDANSLRPITFGIPHAVAIKLSEWHDGPLEDAALTALRLYHGIGPTAHTKLLQAAQILGIGQIKALRTAIDLFVEQAGKLKTAPTPKGRPERPLLFLETPYVSSTDRRQRPIQTDSGRHRPASRRPHRQRPAARPGRGAGG